MSETSDGWEVARLPVGAAGVVTCEPYGDACLLLEPDDADDERAWSLTQRIRLAVLEAHLDGVVGLVSSYRHLLVELDPGTTDAPETTRRLADLLARVPAGRPAAPPREHVVPVVFGGAWGPDLDHVAALTNVAPGDLVRSIVEDRFTVRFLGPGMEPMSVGRTRRGVPRRDSPRTVVPPGSVSMAADNLSIYPFPSPGGWQILGRTPLVLCDISRDPPVGFAPGDVLRLVAVDERDVERWQVDLLGDAEA